jgi:hypothetical protein
MDLPIECAKECDNPHVIQECRSGYGHSGDLLCRIDPVGAVQELCPADIAGTSAVRYCLFIDVLSRD